MVPLDSLQAQKVTAFDGQPFNSLVTRRPLNRDLPETAIAKTMQFLSHAEKIRQSRHHLSIELKSDNAIRISEPICWVQIKESPSNTTFLSTAEANPAPFSRVLKLARR